MADFVLVDAVQLGLTESERRHAPLGCIAYPADVPQMAYAEDRFVQDLHGFFPARHVVDWCGLELFIPEDAAGRPGRLDLSLQGHATPGAEERTRKPAPAYLMTRTRILRLGELLPPARYTWHRYVFEIPPEAMEPGPAYLLLDDRANRLGAREHLHQALGTVELFARIDTAPARTAGVSDREADVVLVMCPVWDVFMPPISLGTLSSFLAAAGLRVKVFDLNIECFHEADEEFRAIWHGSVATRWNDPSFTHFVMDRLEPAMRRLAERIAAMPARHVGFSLATTNESVTQVLSQMIKKFAPEKIITYGGSGVPFLFAPGMGSFWDYLILGAGEHAFLRLVTEGPDGVPGLVRAGQPRDFDPIARRARLTDLNELPLHDFAAFDLTRYLHPWRLPMVTSRGCVNRCKYCFDANFYAPYRSLTGRRGFEQMRHLLVRHGRRRFEFADLLCNGDLDAVRETSRLVRDSGLPVEWGSFAIIRPDMTRQDLELLHAGGCRYLHYGFETASEKLLSTMGRNYTVQDAQRVIRDTHEAGIKAKINIMVGFPGETDRTIAETIRFIQKNAPFIDCVDTVNPVYLMTSTDLDKHRDRWDIRADAGDLQWASGDVDMERRRRWVEEVILAVREAGVTCNYSVIRDFEAMDICVRPDDSF